MRKLRILLKIFGTVIVIFPLFLSDPFFNKNVKYLFPILSVGLFSLSFAFWLDYKDDAKDYQKTTDSLYPTLKLVCVFLLTGLLLIYATFTL